ncbi:hypothetical protein BpHYR1_026277 [Brachionus plicatilis]|uniref:Uncharacterized protein n=1 Tax=Brachionus plicatilis TaxID=10195 RepID=A0A3M7QVW0_BRAPC|nr:hypothetical protein BpHYR1_026277 [Brachionus plicatilis]
MSIVYRKNVQNRRKKISKSKNLKKFSFKKNRFFDPGLINQAATIATWNGKKSYDCDSDRWIAVPTIKV